MEIKAYQDGNDFVVVFKNCHPSQEKMIKNILSPAMCEDSTLLKEAEEESFDTLIGYGKYEYQCAEEVLASEGDRGYANISYLLKNKHVNANRMSAIKDVLNHYLMDRMDSIAEPYTYCEELTEAEARTFAKCYQFYLSDQQMADISEQAGFENFQTFLEKASETKIKSFAACLIEKIKKDIH